VQLELDRITSGYGRSPVLHEVSLAVAAGEIVALIGANGAGKSTLLNTIMGLVAASSGAIRFDARQSIICRRQPLSALASPRSLSVANCSARCRSRKTS
jgi:ABC-type branched-subunit amino acid transport system ATPase component